MDSCRRSLQIAEAESCSSSLAANHLPELIDVYMISQVRPAKAWVIVPCHAQRRELTDTVEDMRTRLVRITRSTSEDTCNSRRRGGTILGRSVGGPR